MLRACSLIPILMMHYRFGCNPLPVWRRGPSLRWPSLLETSKEHPPMDPRELDVSSRKAFSFSSSYLPYPENLPLCPTSYPPKPCLGGEQTNKPSQRRLNQPYTKPGPYEKKRREEETKKRRKEHHITLKPPPPTSQHPNPPFSINPPTKHSSTQTTHPPSSQPPHKPPQTPPRGTAPSPRSRSASTAPWSR
jgi:hypothetical protein